MEKDELCLQVEAKVSECKHVEIDRDALQMQVEALEHERAVLRVQLECRSGECSVLDQKVGRVEKQLFELRSLEHSLWSSLRHFNNLDGLIRQETSSFEVE